MTQLTLIPDLGIKADSKVKSRNQGIFISPEIKELILRDYQEKVKKAVYQAFKGTPEMKYLDAKQSILLVAPTGAGKTVISAKFIIDAVKKGKRVLFCVHRTKLIAQTQATLAKYGVKSGIIWGSDSTNPEAPLQIAMIQSLSSKNRQLPENIDLVVFDECHSSIYWAISKRIFNHYSGGLLLTSKCKFIGLTATPWRLKKTEGFCQFFQQVLQAPTTSELIDLGYLVRPRLFGWGGIKDWSEFEIKGDFSESDMARLLDAEYNATVVEKTLENCPDSKMIAFCGSVIQAEDLANQFNSKGKKAESVTGKTSETERERIYELFRNGEIQIITSVGCLCEGFDETSAEVCILARPTASVSLYKQMVGRVLRPHPGKESCLILDFGDNVKRLGRPTQNLSISLCPNDKPKQFTPQKECPNCHTMVNQFLMICPECGHVFESESGSPDDIYDSFVPEFGELPDEQTLKQIAYIRQQMKTKYTSGTNAIKEGKKLTAAHNPARIKGLFYEKFGYFPNDDWFLGAIFGTGIRYQSNKTKYYDYLKKLNSSSSENWIDTLINLEFGKPGKTYYSEKGEAYCPKWSDTHKNTWYQVLGVLPNDSWEIIKQQYRQLSRDYHPDLNGGLKARAEEAMKVINWAFEKAKEAFKK